jgi:hypothetical protein
MIYSPPKRDFRFDIENRGIGPEEGTPIPRSEPARRHFNSLTYNPPENML